jgi:hypothetical protein
MSSELSRPLRVKINATPEQMAKLAETWAEQFRAYHRTSRFERQAFPDWTPAQVFAWRRESQVSQRRPQSSRPAVRRRACRARSRSPDRLQDPDPEPPGHPNSTGQASFREEEAMPVDEHENDVEAAESDLEAAEAEAWDDLALGTLGPAPSLHESQGRR